MFISYAQNFEDVLLARALAGIACGYYIDVGAAASTPHAVTRAFYDAGWRGINVQPDSGLFPSLKKNRPYDTNLNLALVAAQATEQAVGASSLSEIWQAHVGRRDVHFLRIGIASAAREVLAGNDWRINRPWILVIEATNPVDRTRSHDLWESIILDANYRLAHDDGVNRFYLAAEHDALRPALAMPPNRFDDFVPAGQIETEAEARRADARARQAEQQTRDAVARWQKIEDRLRAVETRMRGMKSSLSWRLTRPIRWLAKRLRKAKARFGGSPRAARPRRGAHVAATAANPIDAAHARLSRRVLNTLRYLNRETGR
jgi:hypothetical protein